MSVLHAVVRGQVQGVGYRMYARIHALMLDLTGWVRNLPDGTVETQAYGTQAALETYLEKLRQGPPEAVVTAVDFTLTEETAPVDLAHTFAIRHDLTH